MEEGKRPPKRRVAEQPCMTHEEIAQRLGLTRAAVSEAERTALAKLKRILHARGFTMEDFFGRDLGE